MVTVETQLRVTLSIVIAPGKLEKNRLLGRLRRRVMPRVTPKIGVVARTSPVEETPAFPARAMALLNNAR
jgi:hypothetical protein